MAEELGNNNDIEMYETYKQMIISDYYNATYSYNEEINIKLPITKVENVCGVKVLLIINLHNNINCKLKIIYQKDILKHIKCLNADTEVLYTTKIYYKDPRMNFRIEDDDGREIFIEDDDAMNEDIKTKLDCIDYKYIYELCDKLKYNKLTHKFYLCDFDETYIDKHICNLQDCVVCYEKTDFITECNHIVCYLCIFKMCKTDKSNIKCPMCRESLWGQCAF